MNLAGFFDFQNFAAFVVAALGAGTVGQLAFMAVRALGKRFRFQSIMGAAGGRALL